MLWSTLVHEEWACEESNRSTKAPSHPPQIAGPCSPPRNFSARKGRPGVLFLAAGSSQWSNRTTTHRHTSAESSIHSGTRLRSRLP